MAQLNRLVKFYFNLHVSQKDILELLAQNHHIVISRSTLQRKLKMLKLYRKGNKTDLIEVAEFIQEAIQQSGALHGYKWMHTKCLDSGIVVDRESVRILLKLLHPHGVKLRKCRRLIRRRYFNHGPNYTWHIDSNDKLRPYGIFINGCIDGFSRLIIWCNTSGGGLARSIGSYYTKAVQCRQGCPRIVRTDMGVENVAVQKMQAFLRRHHVDARAGSKSVVIGDSRANQRIEFWWGILRKECLQFWMDLFKHIQDDGYFSGDYLDKNILRYCFLHLIQVDLDKTVEVWNKHRIRNTSYTGLPCHKPIILYTLSHIYGFADQICEVDQLDIEACNQETTGFNDIPCDADIRDLCEILKAENDWTTPIDAYEASTMYHSLRRSIKQLL